MVMVPLMVLDGTTVDILYCTVLSPSKRLNRTWETGAKYLHSTIAKFEPLW